jgi:hypothetical protein
MSLPESGEDFMITCDDLGAPIILLRRGS